LLENPLLANHSISSNIDKHKKLWQFIFTLFDVYAEKLDTPRHVLVKMQLHWEYLQKYFESQKKYVKKIKKATNIVVYRATVRELYNESEREID